MQLAEFLFSMVSIAVLTILSKILQWLLFRDLEFLSHFLQIAILAEGRNVMWE